MSSPRSSHSCATGCWTPTTGRSACGSSYRTGCRAGGKASTSRSERDGTEDAPAPCCTPVRTSDHEAVLKLPSILRLVLGREAVTDEDREATYYFRVTLTVAVALAAGAILQWRYGVATAWLAYGVAYLVGGWRIAIDSWQELKQRRLSIDFLMGAAAVGAALVGSPLEGVVLIFLFSLSKALEAYAMGRTRHAIARLMDLAPEEATLADDEGRDVGRIRVQDLQPGQHILVRPGERIAADGRVHSGRTEVDQAAITGESMPVRKQAGDEVYAGTVNQGGSVVVEVSKPSSDTMLARIVRLVEEAREERAPAQHFIDRFAHPYTLGVVVATAIAAVAPPLLFGVDWGDAFYRAKIGRA